MKKLYIQPQTENASLEQRINVMVSVSVQEGFSTGYIDAPTRRGNPVAVMYI